MPKLILPIPPGANRIWRTYRNVTVKSKDARHFEQTVRFEAHRQGICPPLDGPVRVRMYYHPKARKKETGKPIRRMDVDAPIKAVLDALIGIAYPDDYAVVKVSSRLANPVPGGQLVVYWEAV